MIHVKMHIAPFRATVSGTTRSKNVPMGRARKRAVLAFGLAAAAAGCTASADQVRPPDDVLFFPTGAAISPDDRYMFVSNANSELRYDSGTVSVFDLDAIDQVANAWVATGEKSGCVSDLDHTETLVCAQSDFILKEASARIGNFATAIAVQDTGGGTARLIIPTRGDPSIAWLDWDNTSLRCNSNGAQGFALCDEAHRLSSVHNNNGIPLPDEPFAVFADSMGQYAVVTHLTSGAVTLVNSPIGGPAEVADVSTGLFAADPATGQRGATGVAGRPSADGTILYVGSRSEDRIQTLTVGTPVNDAPRYLIPSNFFFLNLVGANSGQSSDTRSMAFSASGERLYVVNRRPPSLQVYDTSIGPTGFPRNIGIGATDICRQASTLFVMDAGDGERAYVTCFQDGQLYVVDPRGLGSVVDVVLVGRGPYTVVGSPSRKKIYVTNFLEDSVVVIDVSPTSMLRNRVVLRLARMRPL